jgi:hypothetical protein
LTKHLNTVIAKAVLEFQQQYGKENLVHKKIERCCQMSDFLDKLCVLNHELNDLCNLFNSIFKVSMLVGLNVSFLVVVDQVSCLPLRMLCVCELFFLFCSQRFSTFMCGL